MSGATYQQCYEARNLLTPTEVNSGKFPRWLAKRIRERLKVPSQTYNGRDLIDFALKEIARLANSSHTMNFLDHWGTTKFYSDGRVSFVSEPYLSPEQVLSAYEFAKFLDLEFSIESNSWHFPGSTTRLLFTEKKVSNPQ